MTDRRPDHASRTPTSNPVLRRALIWGGILAAVILVVSGILGFVFAGTEGLVSALVGTIMAVVFMGITAASILLANRFASSDLFVGAFFGIAKDMTTMYEEGFMGMDRQTALFRFAAGQALMLTTGSWDAQSIKKQCEGKFDVGVFAFPVPAAGEKWGDQVRGRAS